ncbi:GATA transcription factor 26-like isoform X3 [Telopea speciosissima]|uniref:GATA transcription factor 26-like isoform X3 n=1 Tax=Telopea speciosissima TaxID=54955 RepID=UPI001CC3C0C1|nr:GATA transcription factor 26-like isoform X3 [Telopea speciosissima]
MGKQGPCYHCGVTSTPLWRNGPPEKPVLCNACGSRWRTKGTLANYTPLHARIETDDLEEYKVPKVKSISFKAKDVRLEKRKQIHDNVVVEGEAPECDQNFLKVLEDDVSNRSSSGSAISYSESCAQFGGTDANELTGPAQSTVWDSLVPSRKRTCVSRPKPSPVEKLTKDLCSILHEQQASSNFSGSSEEDLIFESDTPMVSVEIGHGGVLIKHPGLAAREEESEASSLSVDNKPNPISDAYSGSASLPVHNDDRGTIFLSISNEKTKRSTGQGIQLEHTKRDKSLFERLQLLQSRNSPLRSLDLKEVVSFEEFMGHLTHEEQERLMKYLPSSDTAGLPDSLKSMFDSPQFTENVSSFQQLLAEGVFDLSFSGVNTEDCKTLKRLVLVNLAKSKWVEQRNLLKDVKGKKVMEDKGERNGISLPGSKDFLPGKGPRDGQNHDFPEPKATMKSPSRGVTKVGYDTKDPINNDGYCFSPRSLFTFPNDGNSLMLDSFQFTDDSSDQDLLLDIPSNGAFLQAELLPTSSFSTQKASTCSVVHPNVIHP